MHVEKLFIHNTLISKMYLVIIKTCFYSTVWIELLIFLINVIEMTFNQLMT